jgi:FkbM family methyltransferase
MVTAALPDGSKLRLWSREVDYTCNLVYWRGWTADEPEALPIFYALAQHASVVLDIGANIGLYSLVASYANPRGRVISFEPLPRARFQLACNIRHNRRSNIEVEAYAISNECGKQPLFCRMSTAQAVPINSSLSPEYWGESLNACEQVPVEVTTIDNFCRERGVGEVDLVKIDIEGLEPRALEGMRETLERRHPHLFVEILHDGGTAPALDALARWLGYNVFALDPDGPILMRRIVTCKHRRNYLFTRLTPAELKMYLPGEARVHDGPN